MSKHQDFLFEIGTEELPPQQLQRFSEVLRDVVTQKLETTQLGFESIKVFATPRRLAILVTQLAVQQPDQIIERRGPATSAAYNDKKQPTPAALGFARSCGVEFSQLDVVKNDQGEWLWFKQKQKGQPANALLPGIVSDAIKAFPITKLMRWGSHAFSFTRPVHWLVALLGQENLTFELFGQTTGSNTYGHRFLAPIAIQIKKPADYESVLQSKGKVIADFNLRREKINEQIHQIVKAYNPTAKALVSDTLLDEVCNLVEWPKAVMVDYDPAYLALPREVLISAMVKHQRCFSVEDDQGKLLPVFITVSNIESKDEAVLIAGNRRVMQARLSDAKFFFDQDRKQPLSHRLESLKQVIFQQKLGTLFDKAQRLAKLSEHLARECKLKHPEQAYRAGLLAKCDLMTHMVGEFPELQGLMGYYYATHDNEAHAVARAMNEHYWPRFSGDHVPDEPVSQMVALADRLDTLVGIFSAGLMPTGDKDPYGLRRAALGILRIIIEKQYAFDLLDLLKATINVYGEHLGKAFDIESLLEFCFDRLKHYYQQQGVSANTLSAVLALNPTRPLDFSRRLKAVQIFQVLSEAGSLAAANKRVANLLSKANISKPLQIQDSLLVEPAEKDLASIIKNKQTIVADLIQKADYESILLSLADLKPSVDQFYDQVMVMVDDLALRNNRLALLQALQQLFLQVADISKLAGDIG